jgi:hypothetical protein
MDIAEYASGVFAEVSGVYGGLDRAGNRSRCFVTDGDIHKDAVDGPLRNVARILRGRSEAPAHPGDFHSPPNAETPAASFIP